MSGPQRFLSVYEAHGGLGGLVGRRRLLRIDAFERVPLEQRQPDDSQAGVQKREKDQILEYLERNVPGSDPHRLLDTIRSVHDLRSLAQQPVLLAMIREVLPDVEATLADGRRFRSVDLYERFVNRWLERNDGKHTLLPEHKCRLMSRLAREVWVSGRRTWSAEWMEKWLLVFLNKHPEMELDYSSRMPTQWKQDFRAATFLSRRGNDFRKIGRASCRERV